MSRAVSSAFIAAVNAPNTDEGFLVCVTIAHSSLPVPIYVVNNSQNVIRTVTSTAVGVLVAKAGNDTASTWTTGITNPSYPMSVRVVFAASWDGGNISLIGTDIFDAAQTETITAVANSTVQGLKVWKTITSISKSLVGSNAATFTTQTGSRVVFLACPFEVILSDDSDDRPPQAKITVDGIDRTLIAAVRSINSPPTATLELIKMIFR
jgi:hypothetical protein